MEGLELERKVEEEEEEGEKKEEFGEAIWD